MKKKLLKYTIAAALIIIICIYGTSSKLEVTYYSVESSLIKSDIKAVLISDLHGSYFGKKQKQIISKINKINPDIVFLTGDIYDEAIDFKGSDILLEAISARYTCYYVTGNHEFWANQVDKIKEKLRGYNITVLEGDTKEIYVRGQALSISGIVTWI